MRASMHCLTSRRNIFPEYEEAITFVSDITEKQKNTSLTIEKLLVRKQIEVRQNNIESATFQRASKTQRQSKTRSRDNREIRLMQKILRGSGA